MTNNEISVGRRKASVARVRFVKGKGKIGGFDYHWKVSNFYILIDEEKAEFFGTIKLESGQFSREDLIVGNVLVSYDELENLIYVKLMMLI